jgi:translation initiation factor IF-3
MIMVLAPHRATKAAATAARAGSPRERETGAEAAPPAEVAGPAGKTGE